jgi:hypothetical protein
LFSKTIREPYHRPLQVRARPVSTALPLVLLLDKHQIRKYNASSEKQVLPAGVDTYVSNLA